MGFQMFCRMPKIFNFSLEFFPIGNLHKRFLKIKKFPHLYWDLNPQPLAYEARTISQDHQGR